MLNPKKLQGTYTALITPFTKEGKVDYEKLKELVQFQLKSKINGLVPLGTTGETPSLTDEEKEEILKLVIKEVKGKVPVIPGTGSNNTFKTIESTKKAKELGADAALIVTPYYNKPTNNGILLHFKTIAEAVDGFPIIVYNIGGRTGKNIDTPTMKKLATIPNIIGVKEASGDINQIADVINEIPDFVVMSGDDGMTYPLMAMGGKGVISVASNLIPKEMVELTRLCYKWKWDKALKMHYKLLPLFKVEFIETNPIPIKSALAIKGMIEEVYRLPMCPLMTASRDKLRLTLEDMGLI